MARPLGGGGRDGAERPHRSYIHSAGATVGRATRAELELSAGSRPTRGTYAPEEIERGLMEVALCGGNARRASRELEEKGLKIPRTTLQKWSQSQHVERYAELRREVMPRIHDRMARESEDLAIEYGEAERKTLERYLQVVPVLKPAEAAGAARNMATSRGIATDKALTLRGQPTQITEHRSVDETLKALARLGAKVTLPTGHEYGHALEGSAEEMDDADDDLQP